MEKKTMDTLRAMLCGELEDIVKKGKLIYFVIYCFIVGLLVVLFL